MLVEQLLSDNFAPIGYMPLLRRFSLMNSHLLIKSGIFIPDHQGFTDAAR